MLILYFPLSPGPSYSCIRAKIQRRLRIITYLDVVATVECTLWYHLFALWETM